MKLSDFAIGQEFCCGERTYRCTDIGTRIVAAIRVDAADTETLDTNTRQTTRKTLSRAEAEAMGWFDGPPYAVLERLFDEDDFEICDPADTMATK